MRFDYSIRLRKLSAGFGLSPPTVVTEIDPM